MPEELDAIGAQLGGDVGFLEAVRAGPPWDSFSHGSVGYLPRARGTSANLVERALGLAWQRRNPQWRAAQYVDPGAIAPDYVGANAPAYLPFLAALVRGHGEEESGYYRALQKALGLPQGWSSAQMADLEPVWEDLERWCVETSGRFGIFRYRRLGGYSRIGVPRSQSVLSQRDAVMLTRVFAQAGTTPGQRVTEPIVREVCEIAVDAHFLSRPFREALRNVDFAALTRARIGALLEEWDGVVAGSFVDDQLANGESGEPAAELGIALSLGVGNALPWEVRWRVPGIRDAGVRLLTFGTDQWTLRFSGGLAVTTDASEARQTARRLLSESASQAIEFREIAAEGSAHSPDRHQEGLRLVLPARPLRTLVGEEVHDPDLGTIVHLVERDLPSHGGAYLLSAAANVANVKIFLQRNALAYDECPGDGLPDGWLLLSLPDCSRLSDACRDELPDGLPRGARSRPRAIRLIGGCQIRRAGMRQYLAYDLPQIELDAPSGTTLRADSVELVEVTPGERSNPTSTFAHASALRRFVVRQSGEVPPVIEIRAECRGSLVDRVQLRVAGSGGLRVASETTFALGAQGEAAKIARGLRGVLLDEEMDRETPADDDKGIILSPLGGRAYPNLLSAPPPGVALLDAIAQRGSMAYGAARDLVTRLLVANGEREPNVSRVFRALNARGQLDIEADAKGRWTRVHCAPPTLYMLRGRTLQGRAVAVLGGTPRIEHWRRLLQGETKDVLAFVESDYSSAAPVLRIAASDHDKLRAAAEAWEVPLISSPALQIAEFSATLALVRQDLEQRGVESLGRMGRHAESLSNKRWEFVQRGSGVVMDRQSSHALFRFDDPETAGRHRLHAIGFWADPHTPRFAFVADWRWGLWLAVSAFGAFVRSEFRIDDACPWPFSYSRHQKTLWLPRSLRLPAILERALVLCSGSLPSEHRLLASDHPDGLHATDASTKGEVGRFSHVYFNQFGKSNDQGSDRGAPWQVYRWVPEPVAQAVATRLGGCLQFMD